MSDSTLPFHPITTVQALGWRKARRGEAGPQPIWPILGGAEDEGDGTDDAGPSDKDVDGDAAADQGDDTDSQDDGETDWAAKAKELEAKIEAQQRINRNLDRRGKRDLARIKELEGGKPATSAKDTPKPVGDDSKASEVDVEKIRAEALEQAKKEAQQETLKERVLDKIEAKAKDFADPADAVAMIMRGRDADDFIDDGKIDVDAIQDALTELLEKKPYLGGAAQGGKNRFQGSAEGGAKPHKPQRPQSLDEAVRSHYGSK